MRTRTTDRPSAAPQPRKVGQRTRPGPPRFNATRDNRGPFPLKSLGDDCAFGGSSQQGQRAEMQEYPASPHKSQTSSGPFPPSGLPSSSRNRHRCNLLCSQSRLMEVGDPRGVAGLGRRKTSGLLQNFLRVPFRGKKNRRFCTGLA